MHSPKKLPRGVYERPRGSGIYWIRFAMNGRQRREKVGPLEDAKDLVEIRRADIRRRRLFPDDFKRRSTPFTEIATDFLEMSRISHSPRTYETNKQRMGTLLAFFRGRDAEGVSPQEITRFLGSDPDRLPATRNRYRALLSGTYSLANKNEKLSVNPARLVKQLRENNERARWLEPEQEEKLFAVLDRRYPRKAPEVTLAMHTGVRKSEQKALKKYDADVKRKILTVRKGKGNKLRHVPLDRAAMAAVESLLKDSSSDLLIPPRKAGRRKGDHVDWFERSIEEAGIEDFTWHDLRHHFGSRLAMAGRSLRAIQLLMGHEDFKTTQRYAHLSPRHMADAVELEEKLE